MPTGVYKRKPLSEETKKKISISNRGQKRSKETRENISMSLLGKKRSPEWIKMISEVNKGNTYSLGHKHTEETKDKMSLAGLKGKFSIPPRFRERVAGRPKPTKCELCGKSGRICFDHDHKTGKFRGYICHNCNVVLGLIKDNSKILELMIEYLKK